MVKLPQFPQEGDRVLVLRQPWLDLLLRREKRLEVRGKRLKSGVYFLGMKGLIYGCALLGDAIPIDDVAHWNALRPKHRVADPLPPYKRTFCLPVKRVALMSPVRYVHPRGAVSIVKYRAA